MGMSHWETIKQKYGFVCVFMEMQMRLPHGCVNKNTNLPPYNNDCCVWQETQEEKETLNTHRLDQNWQCHPPTHCVNFGLPWLKLGDRIEILFWHRVQLKLCCWSLASRLWVGAQLIRYLFTVFRHGRFTKFRLGTLTNSLWHEPIFDFSLFGCKMISFILKGRFIFILINRLTTYLIHG